MLACSAADPLFFRNLPSAPSAVYRLMFNPPLSYHNRSASSNTDRSWTKGMLMYSCSKMTKALALEFGFQILGQCDDNDPLAFPEANVAVQTDCLDPSEPFDHLVEHGARPFDQPSADLFDQVMSVWSAASFSSAGVRTPRRRIRIISWMIQVRTSLGPRPRCSRSNTVMIVEISASN